MLQELNPQRRGPSPWARRQAGIADDDPKRIMRLPETTRLVGLCNMSLWRKEQDGRFPKREKIDPSAGRYGAVGHRRGRVLQWLEARDE